MASKRKFSGGPTLDTKRRKVDCENHQSPALGSQDVKQQTTSANENDTNVQTTPTNNTTAHLGNNAQPLIPQSAKLPTNQQSQLSRGKEQHQSHLQEQQQTEMLQQQRKDQQEERQQKKNNKRKNEE
eukprot:CAMPEP_0174266158 /NCGR_PEP_ID=MMETSP0439-20130205/29212_1 /TAXON_ID=0 /ORGANISM="Stereomyxa ramosa, Strain Chinc5" /LENGTH=126 /DNA_ID=CAMNT_0015352957 /DNA_START=154 /DNA_END=531 /DNA_ORIENTATION=+